ncbi:MAG: zf-HC2 domain-containing protein [Armatimonadetes bacterium]|nr:zf-HC2 domain-containing protein [Armatimonadota bacterium]
MFCRQVKRLLNDYVDARLDASRKQRLEEHFASCEACRQLSAKMRLLRNELQSLPHASTSDQFLRRLQAELPSSPKVGFWQHLAESWIRLTGVPTVRWSAAGLGIAVLVILMALPHLPWKGEREQEVRLAQSSFAMECVEQHATYTNDQTMPDTITLAQDLKEPVF